MRTVHTGEEGITITVTLVDQDGTVYDMSDGLDTKEIYLRDPGGTVTVYDASFGDDGADGVLEYVTVSTEIDSPGIWQFQARTDDGGGLVLYSTKGKFRAVDPLA